VSECLERLLGLSHGGHRLKLGGNVFGVENLQCPRPTRLPPIDIPFSSARIRLFLRTESMPNTKSAERRMRNSARKHTRNTAIKSRIKTAEKGYLELLSTGKKDEAAAALRQVSSYYDKAAKSGVVHSR